MRAMICTAAREPLSLEDVTIGSIGPHDVRVQNLASGVCHTDLSVASGFASDMTPFPMVLGHESVAKVLAIGDGVTRCKVGDRVIASFSPACGDCWHCLRDESQLCDLFPEIAGRYHVRRQNGDSALSMAGLGTFAEEFVAHETSLVPIKSDLPNEMLALIGCGVTTGVGAALWTAKVPTGATVAVFGCGGVGQSVIQGARLAGAARIIAVDPVKFKRETALKLGATDVIDSSAGDAAHAVRELTSGRGADYAFEVTGLPAVITQSHQSIRRGGTAVQVGMAPQNSTVSISPAALMSDELKLVGSLYGSARVRRHFQTLVDLAEEGRLNLADMVSRKIGLADVNTAFEAMRDGEVIRSVIIF